MADKDPAIGTWFGVEFQGQVSGAFRECAGLGSENEVVEYKGSGDKGKQVTKKIPGRLKWNNITLKRGMTDSMDMWKWRKMVEDGKIDEARKKRINRHVQPERRRNCPMGFRQRLAFQAFRPFGQRPEQRSGD